jgi:uncharacterized protein DUF3530
MRFFLLFFVLLITSTAFSSHAQNAATEKQTTEKSATQTEPLQDNAANKPAEQSTEKTTSKVPNKSEKNETAPSASIKINLPIDQQTQYQNDLKHYLNASKIKPMLSGSEDFIILLSEETTGNPKGVAILLPDWQQIATSPKAINFLRTRLPEKGWTTITIQSPMKPENYPSLKNNDIERAEENQKTLASYQEKLSAIIKKVMNKARNYPGTFLLVAEGNNAAILVDLYAQQKNKPTDVLVILGGHLLSEKDNKNYAKTLASIEVPVLDLYLARDSAIVSTTAKLSLTQSKKQLKVYYRQQQLDNLISGYYPANDLLKAINGWLKAIGW